MEIQHVNVKLLLEKPESLNLGEIVTIFHSWIQEQIFEELLIDVADYRHVYAGPGVVLVGHEADYSVDNTDNRLGVRYNRKAMIKGSNRDRFAQALRAAATACQQLESDERLQGKLRFGGRELMLFVNDRLLAPNTSGTYRSVEPELRDFFRDVGDSDDFVLEAETDPRRLFGVRVRWQRPIELKKLLERSLSEDIQRP
jgi:hypothetical protein